MKTITELFNMATQEERDEFVILGLLMIAARSNNKTISARRQLSHGKTKKAYPRFCRNGRINKKGKRYGNIWKV